MNQNYFWLIIISYFAAFMWGMQIRPFIFPFLETFSHKIYHLYRDTPKKFRAWRICRGKHQLNELSKIFQVTHVTCFKCDIEFLIDGDDEPLLYNHCTAISYENIKRVHRMKNRADELFKEFFNPEGGIDGYPEN